MLVYVLNSNGVPLMPSVRCGHIRKLLKEHKAKVIKRDPFTIRLLYDTQDAVQNIEQGEKTLIGARKVLKKYRDEYGVYVNMKSYSTMYPYYEMVGIIFEETIINLITSALAVTIVLFLLLPPGPSFLAVICVLLADVCILGWIPFTGLNLNAISSTCLVMSVGIAVDFMAHITHAFVETDSSTMNGGERAAATVIRMGRSLTTSALTTFLSVLMLSVVNVPSHRMFFTMMAGVVLFGLKVTIESIPRIPDIGINGSGLPFFQTAA